MPRINLNESGWEIVNIIVRVISIFLMDEILKSPYSITVDCSAWINYCIHYVVSLFAEGDFGCANERVGTDDLIATHIAFSLLYMIGLAAIVLTFLYPTRLLAGIYLTVSSGLLIFLSYLMNVKYIKYCLDLMVHGTSVIQELFSLNKMTLFIFFINYLSQLFCAIVFCFSFLISPKSQKVIYGFHFIFPTLLSAMAVPEYLLLKTPLFTAAIEFAIIVYYFLSHRSRIWLLLTQPLFQAINFINHNGWLTYILLIIKSFNIWAVFQIFWLIRTAKLAVLLLYESALLELQENGSFALTHKRLPFALKELVAQSCDTFIAIIGMTSILATVLIYVVKNFESTLSLSNSSFRKRYLQFMITFLFTTLAMQVGLTGLEPNERILRLYRNLLLIFPAVALTIQENIDITLMNLSKSGNTSYRKHIKALIGAVAIFLYSCGMLSFLITKHEVNTWFLALCGFNLELALKTVLSIVTYCLYLIDMRHNTIWEDLDKYIIGIATFGYIFNFLFNVFLLFNTWYVLIFESIGVTRIVLMFCHIYFNICMLVSVGWNNYWSYYNATKIVKSLTPATEEQLRTFDDICSICHYPLKSARITKCNHYFHETCLAKWLLYHTSCPFCHKSFSEQKEKVEDNSHFTNLHQD